MPSQAPSSNEPFDLSPSPLTPLLKPDRSGILYALLAYGAWGVFPLYWKLFGTVPALEILCHRMIWSMLLLWGVLGLQQRWGEIAAVARSPRALGLLLATATLLSVNWGLYIYGVNSDRIVETSLGYFINPLVNVLLGFVVLRERLSRAQQVAVGLAAAGVLNFVGQVGQPPWIALTLAFTFALYGLLRKLNPVAPMVGLAVETALLAPMALVAVGYGSAIGSSHFGQSLLLTLLFVGAGLVTSLPLLWFNNAAQRLPLSTLGFFQYLAPSIQLLLAVLWYHEVFTTVHQVTFGLIWVALGIYSVSAWRSKQSAQN